jgi:hypothetical protein
VLERAIDCGVHETDFATLGFDAWEVYELSFYGWYSRCFNLWMGYRNLLYGSISGSHFCRLPPTSLDLRKPQYLEPWAQWAMATKQVTINWQFQGLDDPVAWKNTVATIRMRLRALPEVKSLWFQGPSIPEQIFNIVRCFPEYECFFISSSPWVRALKRKAFAVNGKYKRTDQDRYELLLQNQDNYVTLVNRAIKAAKRSVSVENGKEKVS